MFFYRETQPSQSIAQLRASFNILQAFHALDPQRKMALYDRLMGSDSIESKRIVRLMWPQANDNDVVNLSNFLRRRAQSIAA